MIYSMTAFSRIEESMAQGLLSCEMRSVNSRYLELNLYLPEPFRIFEMPIRDLIRQQIKRGKIDCVFNFEPKMATDSTLLSINHSLVDALLAACNRLAISSAMVINPMDILRYPGVMNLKKVEAATLENEIVCVLEKAIVALIQARGREGEGLKQLFLQRFLSMEVELLKVRQRLPVVLAEIRERFLKRFTDIQLELDAHRLEQEMLIFANKMDVAEELDRTDAHLKEVRRIIEQGGTVGRRLDFLLQELNREANTLGSKSNDTVITLAAVELKVLIEQVREQVQNIE